VIVKLVPDDWATFRAIRLESLERAPHVFGTARHQEADRRGEWWRSRLASADLGVHVALLAGEPVGMAGWLLPAAANTRHRAYVWGVYVRDGLRGGGVGRALMTATLAEAEARSDAIDLNVLTDNAPAIGLYESLGFVVVGTVPRALKHAGVYRDQHLMARDPGAQSTPGTLQSPVV
jgi:ribosomal protein S18 acetylase RimI-like enzyme